MVNATFLTLTLHKILCVSETISRLEEMQHIHAEQAMAEDTFR